MRWQGRGAQARRLTTQYRLSARLSQGVSSSLQRDVRVTALSRTRLGLAGRRPSGATATAPNVVLRKGSPSLAKESHDGISAFPSTLSFRIRFSGEESASSSWPGGSGVLTLREGLPTKNLCIPVHAVIRTRIRVRLQAYRHGRTLPPAPIGRNRHRTLLRPASHQDPPAHGEGAFKSSSSFRGLKFRRHAHARIRSLPQNNLPWPVPGDRFGPRKSEM